MYNFISLNSSDRQRQLQRLAHSFCDHLSTACDFFQKHHRMLEIMDPSKRNLPINCNMCLLCVPRLQTLMRTRAPIRSSEAKAVARAAGNRSKSTRALNSCTCMVGPFKIPVLRSVARRESQRPPSKAYRRNRLYQFVKLYGIFYLLSSEAFRNFW